MISLLIALLAAINIEFCWDVEANSKGYQIGVSGAALGTYTFVDVGAGVTPTVCPVAPNRRAYVWPNFDPANRFVVLRGYNDIYTGAPTAPYPVGEPGAPQNVIAVKKP